MRGTVLRALIVAGLVASVLVGCSSTPSVEPVFSRTISGQYQNVADCFYLQALARDPSAVTKTDLTSQNLTIVAYTIQHVRGWEVKLMPAGAATLAQGHVMEGLGAGARWTGILTPMLESCAQ